MTTAWGAGQKIQRWPKPGPDEVPDRWTAEWQELDGSWTVLVQDVLLKDALRSAREFKSTYAVPPETRVRKEG